MGKAACHFSRISQNFDRGWPLTLHFDSPRAVFVALILAGCGADAPPPEPEPVPEVVESTCGDSGYFRTSLSGALRADIDWPDAALRCESMRRPDDRGVRLRFSGDVGTERLAVIIAIPELEPGVTGPEFDSIITVTVDGSGRFFSTPNLGACWTDISKNAMVADSTYQVEGVLTCVGPLGEFNGDAFVAVSDLHFSGLADWEAT